MGVGPRLSHLFALLVASREGMSVLSKPQIKTHNMRHDLITRKRVCNRETSRISGRYRTFTHRPSFPDYFIPGGKMSLTDHQSQ